MWWSWSLTFNKSGGYNIMANDFAESKMMRHDLYQDWISDCFWEFEQTGTIPSMEDIQLYLDLRYENQLEWEAADQVEQLYAI
jgi:hypothetical protein